MLILRNLLAWILVFQLSFASVHPVFAGPSSSPASNLGTPTRLDPELTELVEQVRTPAILDVIQQDLKGHEAEIHQFGASAQDRDSDPFWMRSQRWDSQPVPSEIFTELRSRSLQDSLEVQVPGARRTWRLDQPMRVVGATADELFLLPQRPGFFRLDQGFFIVRISELQNASLSQGTVPVFFFHLPGYDWEPSEGRSPRAEEIPHRELVIFVDSRGAPLPVSLGDIHDVVRVEEQILQAATIEALSRRLRQLSQDEVRRRLTPHQAEFEETIRDFHLAVSRTASQDPAQAQGELGGQVQRVATLFNHLAHLFHQILGDEEALPLPGSTAMFGTLYVGSWAEAHQSSIFRLPQWMRRAFQSIGVPEARAFDWSAALDGLQAALERPANIHVFKILSGAFIAGVVLRYTLLKHRIEAIRAENGVQPATTVLGRLGQELVSYFDVYAHNLAAIVQFPGVWASQLMRYVLDRGLAPLGVREDSWLNRKFEHYIGFRRDTSSNTPTNARSFFFGVIGLGGTDTACVALQLFVTNALIATGMAMALAPLSPSLAREIVQAFAPGNAATLQFNVTELALNGIGYITTGAIGYATQVHETRRQEVERDLRERMRARGLNLDNPADRESFGFATQADQMVSQQLADRGLPSPNQYLWGAATLWRDAMMFLGFNPYGPVPPEEPRVRVLRDRNPEHTPEEAEAFRARLREAVLHGQTPQAQALRDAFNQGAEAMGQKAVAYTLPDGPERENAIVAAHRLLLEAQGRWQAALIVFEESVPQASARARVIPRPSLQEMNGYLAYRRPGLIPHALRRALNAARGEASEAHSALREALRIKTEAEAMPLGRQHDVAVAAADQGMVEAGTRRIRADEVVRTLESIRTDLTGVVLQFVRDPARFIASPSQLKAVARALLRTRREIVTLSLNKNVQAAMGAHENNTPVQDLGLVPSFLERAGGDAAVAQRAAYLLQRELGGVLFPSMRGASAAAQAESAAQDHANRQVDPLLNETRYGRARVFEARNRANAAILGRMRPEEVQRYRTLERALIEDSSIRQSWIEEFRNQLMSQAGLYPDLSRADLIAQVETRVSELYEEFLGPADSLKRRQLAELSEADRARITGHLKAGFFIEAYVKRVVGSDDISATDAAQPGRFQRVRQTQWVRDHGWAASTIRAIEGFFPAGNFGRSFWSDVQRYVPAVGHMSAGLTRVLKLLPSYLIFGNLYSRLVFHTALPMNQALLFMVLNGPLVNGGWNTVQAISDNLGWRPGDRFRQIVAFSSIGSWCTFGSIFVFPIVWPRWNRFLGITHHMMTHTWEVFHRLLADSPNLSSATMVGAACILALKARSAYRRAGEAPHSSL